MYGLNRRGIPCENAYEMADEPLLAALFTTGNGYMGVRGSFEEYASLRIQGAFVRGFIDEIIEVCEPFADNEYMKKYYLDEEGLKRFEKQESGINLPDFLLVRVEIGGRTFFPWEGKILSWERTLDPSTGELKRRVVWDDGAGRRTELLFRRFASFADRHLFCQQVKVRPLNHRLPVKILSGVDTAVKTGGQFVTRIDEFEEKGNDLVLRFSTTGKFGFSARYDIVQRFPAGVGTPYRENGRLGVGVLADSADEYVFEKFVRITTSRDEPDEQAVEPSYAVQFERHARIYREAFFPMDIKIEGDAEADGWLRFASYHTIISADPDDCVHGASAKGLTGERYNQFVWWDCEIHQLPFFLHTAPKTAKQLLLYRSRCLEQAKENARAAGMRGAKFAFCSSVTGEERVWEYVRHPFLQVHIDSDIPYGVIHYYDCTGDDDYLREFGLELLYECAKYWTSRVTERNGRYEILKVTGTDEHHPYVDNDAYTNYCVAYVLKRFSELADRFAYPLDEGDKELIADIAARLYLPREANGMIPQFDGYFKLSRGLEEAGKGTLKQFQMKKSGLYHKSQVIKQPDVALLYTMVDVGADKRHFAENWDYYEKMCETSSSLTFPVHAIASARCRRMLSFYDYFMQTLKIDVDDIHGVGWQGVHSGCLAGGYLSVLYGLMGLVGQGETLCFEPAPCLFEKVTMRLIHRGRRLRLTLGGGNFSICLEEGTPIPIRVKLSGGEREVLLKKRAEFRLEEE